MILSQNKLNDSGQSGDLANLLSPQPSNDSFSNKASELLDHLLEHLLEYTLHELQTVVGDRRGGPE